MEKNNQNTRTMSEAEEYRKQQGFDYDSFTKLTSTGIEPNYEAIENLMESYHQHKMREVLEKNYNKQIQFAASEYDLETKASMVAQTYFEIGANWLLNHLKTKIKEG